MNQVVDIIFGGNAGSEGKGKFAGYLARKNNVSHAISNFFPNAGHTWRGNEGEKVVTRFLPSSVVNPDTKLYLGPGSAIDLSVLWHEIAYLSHHYQYSILDRLKIHPRAAIIDSSHVEIEKAVDLERIGSTLKGGSAAVALKAMRVERQKLAQHIEEFKPYLGQTEVLLQEAVSNNELILIEGAQGFELDINYGYEYPYTTSRQTTPAQLLADAGLPNSAVRDIYCVIRTFPIRVANPERENCTSGPLGKDKEISWGELESRAGAPQNSFRSKETTTVTCKTRRVFQFDEERFKYMISLTRPTKLCLNFIQYINYKDYQVRNYSELSDESKRFIDRIQEITCVPIKYVGTGPLDQDIIEINGD